MKEARRLMAEALARGVFPGAVLYVQADGAICLFEAWGQADIFSHTPMTRETVFDLASLTKPLATAPAVLKLVQEGRLGVDDRIGDILADFRGTDKHSITLADLLSHCSGLPDHREYFRKLARLPVEERRPALTRMLAAEPLVYRPGEQTVYSDLGYMVLRLVVERISGRRLDRFVRAAVHSPLGVEGLFFVDRFADRPLSFSPPPAFAATERCPRRGFLLKGLVHDDNAYEIGGIDGQAGLFGSAAAVAGLLQILLDIYQGKKAGEVLAPDTVRQLLIPRRPGRRPFGFDVPETAGSSSGTLFSELSAGHLGFTGTSVWMDISRRILVLLLTNRVHPDRANGAIRTFRPELHQAVMSVLLDKGDAAGAGNPVRAG